MMFDAVEADCVSTSALFVGAGSFGPVRSEANAENSSC